VPLVDALFLEMALVGYEAERQKIETKINELQKLIGRYGPTASLSLAGSKPRRKRRKISAEGLKRIAEAQRKRWAKVHAQQKRVARPKATRKAVSPDVLKKRIEALAKARAAKAAKAKAARL
jgi:hypothetical protein